jgi:hypothetical protein
MPEEGATKQASEPGVAVHDAERIKTGSADRPGLRWSRWFGGLLIAIGIGLIPIAYYAVYPRPQTAIPVPSSPSLVILTAGHVSQITYMATTDAAGRPEMRVTVSLGEIARIGSELTPLPVPPHPAGLSYLEVTLPPGLAFRSCGRACITYAGEAAWVQPLDFQSGKATDVFPIKTAHFGTDVSSVYAYAAIPQVSLMNPASEQNPSSGSTAALSPVLTAEYRIPSGHSYDWSSGPVPTKITRSIATWQEILPASAMAGQTAAGVDHAQQTDDADSTFVAGFLLGLAGSVVLAGFQLLLPPAAASEVRHGKAGTPSAAS